MHAIGEIKNQGYEYDRSDNKQACFHVIIINKKAVISD
jgi:hypothetical protein